MLFGNRRPRKSDARRRSLDIHRPRGEQLEDRTLLSIDLGGTAPSSNPLIATAPFGFAFGGSNMTATGTTLSNGGAGWSVSDLGDVNGDGYDDFLIGGPTTTGAGVLGTGLNGAAYLIFGSNTVGQTQITDWLGTNTNFPYAANNRVGDLGQLGLTTQTNPINGASLAPTPFAGVTFVTGGDVTSALGASVSSVRLSNGTFGLLIGAPNGVSTGGSAGTGRAYFITSTNWSSLIGQTINLDVTPPTGMNVTTFVNSISGGQLGYSVAGGFNIFGDNSGDIILGAPTASYGATNGTGAVFVVSLSTLGTSTQTIDVSTQIGQGGNSVIFAGASAGSNAGWSVADAGDVNGVTAGGSNVDDLIIGAPNQGGGGAAYLVYGGANLPNLAQTVTVNGVNFRYINLANVGATTGTGGGSAVPGATILGPTASRTGQAVSSGGDFNSDGFGDILVGSPQFSSSSTVTSNGLASLLYGAASTATGFLTGTITLGSTPSGISPLYLTGATSGSLAGYAVSPVGFINSGQPSLILVGAPGFNNNSGTAYLIPGRTGGLTGTQSLAGAESSPLSGVQFLLTTPNAATLSPPFFGASVSSRFQTTTFTADSDSLEDFIIGAPGYDVTQDATRVLAGGAMIVQGGKITVPTPGTTQIVTQIGVGTPFAPFSINATTPANLQIFVFGTTTASGQTFQPVRDINPATIVVNGVAFPNATLLPDPNQANWVNGIQDAIITITPRSSLGLTNGTNTITISGQTLPTSPLAGSTWTGSTSVNVTGSSSGGGGSTSALAGIARGPVLETTFNSFFGPTQYVPTISQLSEYNYAPIPTSVALQQYQPATGFNDRIYNFNHPGKHLKNFLTIRGPAATGIWGSGSGSPGPSGLDYRRHNPRTFINNQILDRSRFHPGRSYKWTHGGLPKIDSIYHGVVPVQLTTEHIAQVPGVKANGNRQIGRAHDSGATFRSSIRGQGL
jgi:hypothetical protein